MEIFDLLEIGIIQIPTIKFQTSSAYYKLLEIFIDLCREFARPETTWRHSTTVAVDVLKSCF